MSQTAQEKLAALDREIAQMTAARRDIREHVKSKEQAAQRRRWMIIGRVIETYVSLKQERRDWLSKQLQSAKLTPSERKFMGLPPVTTPSAKAVSGNPLETSKSAV